MSTEIVGVHEKNLLAYFAPMLPEQSRAARAWLDWSQDELAAKASVSLSTVRDFEKGRRVPIANNLTAMRVVLEKEGIDFVDGAAPGITFSKRKRR
ncbi:MAG: helix-turn-helix transcriptional regulator [Xanthobacteraceae bacterium]